MPLPFILAGAAVVAGLTGAAKGVSAISKNSDAKEMMASAQRGYERAKGRLEEQRNDTTKSLEKLGTIKVDVWAKEMNDFVQSFNSFKNVRMEGGPELNERLKLKIKNPQNLKNMEVATVKAAEIAQAGVASLGAGALAGIASYGGAMMFASASTGTAIAALSGAAATNATLAWFGGGALTAGGLGMAGGSMVLGGIVAGPALAVAGFIMDAKANENLANARKVRAEANDAIEKMDTMSDFMEKVSEISDNYSEFIAKFRVPFRRILNNMIAIEMREKENLEKNRSFFSKLFGTKEKVDFDKLSVDDQKTLHEAWLMAQVLYTVLATPILTQKGDLDSSAETALQDAQTSCPMLSQ